MGNPTGVAIIGTGGIAEAHIFAYQKEAERARIVALVDIDRSRAEAAAARYGIDTVCDDYRDVLRRDDVEAISICTPPFTHVEIACEALRAGKHVLCEKPVAPTLAGLDTIDEAQKRSGRVFSGVFQLRFGRGAQQVRLLAGRRQVWTAAPGARGDALVPRRRLLQQRPLAREMGRPRPAARP